MGKVTLTKVFRKDVDTRYGIKPKVSIMTVEHGEKWLSSFKVKGTENWEDGMEVAIDVQEKGDFMNFNPTGVSSTATQAPSNLETRVKKLEDEVFGAVDVSTDDETDSLEAEFKEAVANDPE